MSIQVLQIFQVCGLPDRLIGHTTSSAIMHKSRRCQHLLAVRNADGINNKINCTSLWRCSWSRSCSANRRTVCGNWNHNSCM